MMNLSILQIGCGNMGGAMLQGWLSGGISPTSFTVVDPLLASAPAGVSLLRKPPSGGAFDVVLLGFKPQELLEVAPTIAPLVGEGTLLLSILAGVDLDTLRQTFPYAGGIVRVMPSLAVALGKSPIVLIGDVGKPLQELTNNLMFPLGKAEWLADEHLMDLVTALSGSGPAFVFRVIDALARGAEALGLPAHQADRLALSMVVGSAAIAAASEQSPAELARRVASPGGVTQKGLDVLDEHARVFNLFKEVLKAARDRSAEMTRAAQSELIRDNNSS